MFEQYRGRNQGQLFEHELTRKGTALWLERVLGFYGEKGGVDIEIIDGQLAITPRTADYIYSDFTPTTIHYRPGSRPELEAIVKEHVKPGMSQREKALALMRRVRDNQDHGLAKPFLFYGGTEEEILKRGGIMCNEVSRLFACLCQIAGLPARVHCAHMSGHMMNEVYTDGKWTWIDSMMGLAPVMDDDTPASTWDLMRDPSLFERQPRAFWDDARPYFIRFGTTQRDRRNLALRLAAHRDTYFNPLEANAIGNYFVWDNARYTYPWRIDMDNPDRLAQARHDEALNLKTLGWPDYYFHALLFNQEFKMRG